MADRKPLVRVGGKSKQLPAGDSISKAVVGLGNVTNDAQAKAAIYPNTVPAAGRILVGQTTGKYESHAMAGDATLSESGLVTISNGAVTNAKQGPMAAGTLKGNKYAVTAAPQDLTPAEARSVLGLGTAAVVNTGTGPSDAILGNDARLSDSREWSAATVDQAEAEAGTATTRRAWTAQRVRQAIAAWWNSTKGALVGPICINGDLEFTGTASRIRGDFSNATQANRVMFQTSTVNAQTALEVIPNGASNAALINISTSSADPANSSLAQIRAGLDVNDVRFSSARRGGGTYLPMTFYTGGVERMRIDSSGNVLVTSPALLGYGPGAGGTVVQSTSKSTAVTLNKPTGLISMHNETLAGGASVNFIIFNSLCSSLDTIVVTVGDNANYIVSCVNVAGGAFRLRITNITGSALSEAISINFSIIKGAAS